MVPPQTRHEERYQKSPVDFDTSHVGNTVNIWKKLYETKIGKPKCKCCTWLHHFHHKTWRWQHHAKGCVENLLMDKQKEIETGRHLNKTSLRLQKTHNTKKWFRSCVGMVQSKPGPGLKSVAVHLKRCVSSSALWVQAPPIRTQMSDSQM